MDTQKENTFTIRLWCKNCHGISDYTFPAGTYISHSRLVGDDTTRVNIGSQWSEVRCKICKVGSLT
jgi:hypothetical protein